jgi:hypothetical protein
MRGTGAGTEGTPSVAALWLNREQPAAGRTSLFTAPSAIQSTRPRLASPAILETGGKRFPCPAYALCGRRDSTEGNTMARRQTT